MVRGVIFDIDGTLVDSNDAHAWAWVRAFAEFDYDVSFEQVRPLIGMGGDKLVPALTGLDPDSRVGRALRDRRSAIFRTLFLPTLQPLPGARELVQRLRDRGLELTVATSATEKELRPLLEKAGVAELLAGGTTGTDTPSKPDPDPICAALEQLGLPAEEVVMIGDTPYDEAAAHKAGVKMIALLSGGFGPDDFAGPEGCYRDPADLAAHLEGSPLSA